MKRSHLLLGLSAVFLLAALTFYETRLIARRQSQSAALELSLQKTAGQLSALRQTRERDLHDLSAAHQQLEELTALIKPALAATERERESEMQAWLARSKQLHAWFDQNPDQQIPELRLLTDADWLRASRKIDLTDEEPRREALAKVRAIAKEKFTRDLARALTKFTAAHDEGLPSDVLELAAYLPPPADPAMLQRYALFQSEKPPEPEVGKSANKAIKPFLALQEKTAIDADYDTRPYVMSNGGFGSNPGPEAWIDHFRDLRLEAIDAYRTSNRGATSLKLADLIPYMNPPLPPATVEKILAAERKRTR